MKCIYCKNIITSTSTEHIIQSAFGSNLKSKNIICPDCNNFFSRNESGKIDDVLANQFKEIRNLLNIWGDRKTPPPTLRNVAIIDGVPLHLGPGGVPIFGKSIRNESVNDKGELTIEVQSPNLEKAKEQIFHLKRQKGENNFRINNASLNQRYIKEYLKLGFSFGGEIPLKAILKSLYGFIFYILRDKKININLSTDSFDSLRNYLRYNIPTNEVKANVDYNNSLPIEINSQDISNYLFVFGSKSDGIIWGYKIILGQIQFSALLKSDYIGDDFGYGVKVNPEDKSIIFYDNIMPPPYKKDATLNYPNYANTYFNIVESKVTNLLIHYHTKSVNDIISSISSKALNEVLRENENMTEEKYKEFINKLAEDFINFQFKIPLSQDIKDDLV